ncbi:PQQ-like beta-propeller repeat protein [Nocardia sp. NBC_01499]|uniref:outer membrane protein assembly factor BamB family protein n=1 Tax=Nocardia sp. NBC_01499 TaxID=2903597 RepID=UPI003864FC61
MASIPGMRNLIIAAAVAVITSAGAVVVLMQPDDGPRKVTGTAAAAPGLAWSVAAATQGHASEEFRDPTAGTEYDSGSAGFIDAGDTLVAAIGVSNGGASLGDPMLVGIDAATGAVRWRTPAAHLGGCARVPIAGQLVCFTSPSAATPALIGYDIASGKLTQTPTNWTVFALAVIDNRLYLAEGDVESDDVRVHSGTLADPDANWSRGFAIGTTGDDLAADVLDVSHGQGLLTLGTHLAGFDLGTGAPTWTAGLSGCSSAAGTSGALVVRTNTDCAGHRVTGTDVLDRTGQVLAASDQQAAHNLSIDRPTDDTIPVLLADGAYDRHTGNLMWNSPDLVSADTGTATAILGDVALLRDAVAHNTTGLDMRTGQRLWQVDTERSGTPTAWDGHVVVLADATGLWAIDPKSGKQVWDIPFAAGNDTPGAITSDGQLTAHDNDRFTYAADRTMIALHPIEH